MVQLDVRSKVEAKESPLLAQWDRDMRQNHETYQKRIDATTYHLQRSQRGIAIFGQWMYPRFFQKDVLELEVLRRKQQLGKIYPEEVATYKSIDPEIADNLNVTFNAKFVWPIRGLAVGSAAFVVAHAFNLPYSLRIGLFALPTIADLAITWGNKEAQFKSIEFMDYLIQYRTARCLIEKNSKFFSNEQKTTYHETVSSTTNVHDLHSQLVDLVIRQASPQ